MITKYDVGERVFVEGMITNIKADCEGLIYRVEFKGELHNFKEDQIYPFIVEGGADDKSDGKLC